MANNVLSWAYKQRIKPSSAKFVLTVLADCASDDGECYPSQKYIAECTSLDRKTIIASIDILEKIGIIKDTGQRKGQTGQVKVYRIDMSEEYQNRDDCTTLEQSQKRNSPKNGTVPFFPPKSPNIPVKESQYSHIRVPKTGHGTIIKPSRNHKEPSYEEFSLPDWVPKSDWENFLAMRKQMKKPPTDQAMILIVRELEKLKTGGDPPGDVLQQSIRNCWLDVFPIRKQFGAKPKVPEKFEPFKKSSTSWIVS